MRFILVYEMPAADIEHATGDISKMLAENRLTHNVAQSVPLDDIVAAHQAVENGAVGKVVVTIP
jgi:NADPH2:quinone reductase